MRIDVRLRALEGQSGGCGLELLTAWLESLDDDDASRSDRLGQQLIGDKPSRVQVDRLLQEISGEG